MSKIPTSDINKTGLFQTLPYIQRAAILVSQVLTMKRFGILILCNILHLAMNFGNLY